MLYYHFIRTDQIITHHITSHHIPSHHITSHPIPSHHITSQHSRVDHDTTERTYTFLNTYVPVVDLGGQYVVMIALKNVR